MQEHNLGNVAGSWLGISKVCDEPTDEPGLPMLGRPWMIFGYAKLRCGWGRKWDLISRSKALLDLCSTNSRLRHRTPECLSAHSQLRWPLPGPLPCYRNTWSNLRSRQSVPSPLLVWDQRPCQCHEPSGLYSALWTPFGGCDVELSSSRTLLFGPLAWV